MRCGLFAVAVLAAALVASPAPAADPPAELKLVPPDAAVFFHADVQKVWTSKLGDTFRKVKAKDIDGALKFLKDVGGVTPADIKTFTFFVPKTKSDGQPPFGMLVKSAKPYDRAKVVAYLKKELGTDKMPLEEKPNHRYVAYKMVTFDLADDTSFRVYFQMSPDDKVAATAADTPQAKALAAAAAGKPLVLGVTFASLPDEIRGDTLPPQIRPFQPLFFTDSGVGVAEIVGDDFKLDVKFTSQTRVKAVEAEKSLGAFKALVEVALMQALEEVEKNKELADKPLVDFVKAVLASVKAVAISNDVTESGVAMKLKADTDFAPLLELAFGKASSASAMMMDANNLKQLALAMHNYESSFGKLPPSAVLGKKGKPNLSWRVTVLPFVEHDALYKKFKMDEPWDSEHNKKVFDENPMPPVFRLPGEKEDVKDTRYQVFVGNGAMFDLVQGGSLTAIQDGTSNTLMIATAKKAVPWTKPDDLAFDPKKDPAELLHFVNDACNVAFGDGSVRALKKKLPAETWRALVTKAGGEAVDLNSK